MLALVALSTLLHHGYLSLHPLASDDWPWFSTGELRSFFPWPAAWDSTVNFGRQVFQRQNSAPWETLAAAAASAGLGWNLSEKLLYFLPHIALVVIGPWLLARELLGSRLWALVAAALFATNSYVLLSGTSWVGLAVAADVASLVFLADIRAKTRGDARWALAAGALIAVAAIYDVRIAFLIATCLLLKDAVELVSSPSRRAAARVLALAVVRFSLLALIQLYWLWPFLMYQLHHGQAQLPIATVLFPAFATLGHAVAAVDPYWTGGVPTGFHTVPLAWIAYALPIVAFCSLFRSRMRLEIVWLLLCALTAAFLVKQDEAPGGDVYVWLFYHLPGWGLFREARKLLWIVALGYAIAVPATLQALAARRHVRSTSWRGKARVAAVVSAMACGVALITAQVVPGATAQLRGDLGGTTSATPEPVSFQMLSSLLAADSNTSPVAFLGGPSVNEKGRNHYFIIASEQHPLLQLFGTSHANDPTAVDNDLLSALCPGAQVPFCYLHNGLFRYLVRELHVGYVVAPAGSAVGVMPEGVSRSDLISQVAGALGTPRILNAHDRERSLAVWILPTGGALAAAYPAVAAVRGTPQQLLSALPALEALRIPAIYAENQHATAETIDVIPNLGGQYRISRPAQYAIALAAGAAVPAQLSVNNRPLSATLMVGAHGRLLKLDQPLPASTISITGLRDSPPLVQWTSATSDLLEQDRSPEGALATQASSQEIAITAPREPWLEVRETFDPAWHVSGADGHATADGLLNLYHLPPSVQGKDVRVTFDTRDSERLAPILAASLAAVFAAACVFTHRRRRRQLAPDVRWSTATRLSRGLAAVGVALLVMTMIDDWLDSSSAAGAGGQWLTDALRSVLLPYSIGMPFYLGLAMIALTLALVTRVLTTRPRT